MPEMTLPAHVRAAPDLLSMLHQQRQKSITIWLHWACWTQWMDTALETLTEQDLDAMYDQPDDETFHPLLLRYLGTIELAGWSIDAEVNLLDACLGTHVRPLVHPRRLLIAVDDAAAFIAQLTPADLQQSTEIVFLEV